VQLTHLIPYNILTHTFATIILIRKVYNLDQESWQKFGIKLSTTSTTLNELISLVAQLGLEHFLRSTHVMVGSIDSNGRVELSNPAFDSLRPSLPGATTLREFISSTAQMEYDKLLQYTRRSKIVTQTILEFGSQAQPRQFDCMFVPLEADRFLFFCEPVPTAGGGSELQQLETELDKLKTALENKKIELQSVLTQADEVSHTDALTFLPNRRFIIADLQRQVTFSERYDTPLAISMIDLDHFKKINDTYGHSSGDDVLRFVASELRDHTRQPDEIGRYGGEEFLVLLPNSGLKAACEQASRLCQQVRTTPIISGGKVIHMTISIGIAQYRIHKENWQELLDRSDQALRQAKQNGRDQWAVLEG
jgi:diguanylate cyclase (GGDEF)-like protein